MVTRPDPTNWHLLVDRFIWYDDLKALELISLEITDIEIQAYIYMYFGDPISLEEIRAWREGRATVERD